MSGFSHSATSATNNTIQQVGREIIDDLWRRQVEHDAACDCNKQTNVKTGAVTRYPNIIGGAGR